MCVCVCVCACVPYVENQAQSANMSGYHYSLQGWIIDSRWEGVGQRFVGKESVGRGGGLAF